MLLQAVLMGLLAVGSIAGIQAAAATAGTTLIVTDPQRRSVRAVTVSGSNSTVAGNLVSLTTTFDTVCCSAAADEYAFVAGTKAKKDSLAVVSIGAGTLKVVKSLGLPGPTSGFFSGCTLTGEGIAAKKTGANYEVYTVIGCRLSEGQRPAANYVVMYTYMPSSATLTGPSEQRVYYINKFDGVYGFVSVVNSMSVFGGGDAGSGTVYAVMTTTSASNGKVYKPALHVFKDQKAVPLGILATAPDIVDGVEAPCFAIASPTSFFSVYRQRCHFFPGANHCVKYPFNAQEAVTWTRQGKGSKMIGSLSETNSYSPSALAVGPTASSPSQQALYRLSGSSFTTQPMQALLQVRSATAVEGAEFETAAELPYISEQPDSRDSLQQLTAV